MASLAGCFLLDDRSYVSLYRYCYIPLNEPCMGGDI